MVVLIGRFITPVVALVVLVIGLISASYEEEGKVFKYVGFFKGSVPTYFLAKTLFCSTVLFLLGQLLAEVVELRRSWDSRTSDSNLGGKRDRSPAEGD